MPSILHTWWRILTACNEFVSYASQNGTKWLWWFVQLKKRTFWHAIKAKNRFLHWSKPPSEKCSCTWRVSFLFQSKHDDHIGIEKWGIPPYHGIPLHLRQFSNEWGEKMNGSGGSDCYQVYHQAIVVVMYNVHTGQLWNDHIHVRVVFMDCWDLSLDADYRLHAPWQMKVST